MVKSTAAALLATLAVASAAHAQLRGTDLRTALPEMVLGNKKVWGADLGFGGNFNRGNTDIDYIGGSFALFKAWQPCTVYLNGSAVYNTYNGIKVINQGSATARYDHPLSKNGPWKVFVFNTNAYNYFLRLNYRSTSGAGPWYDFALGSTKHGVSVAPAYEYEDFKNHIYRRTGRLSFRGVSKFPISKAAEFNTDFFYVPSLDADGNFRLFGEIAFQTLVWKEFLGLKLSWTDEYESRPLPGVKRNDSIWMTSLVVHLGR
ncbi:MAG: DUF481 domain-containing protein [Elusimicrobia bacterium]|nr:DUF481 domain-containing protein [Elusimicrobiota bacterium]